MAVWKPAVDECTCAALQHDPFFANLSFVWKSENNYLWLWSSNAESTKNGAIESSIGPRLDKDALHRDGFGDVSQQRLRRLETCHTKGVPRQYL
jgi:hypothetical protein